MTSPSTRTSMGARFLLEVRKLPAFIRRDFLTAWSYRMAFFGDGVGLAVQIVMFYFVGLMVDPSKIPEYGGQRASYLAFVTIGIALGAFLTLGLNRVAMAMRSEQLMGTLDSLFMTPTHPMTLQLGLAVYDLVYVPIRTALFIGIVSLLFEIGIAASGILPSLAILLLFIPFVWGLGMVSAAGVMTFRRGATILNLGALALNFSSGAYFPVDLLPGWMQGLTRANPIALAFDGTRQALLGGVGWKAVTPHVGIFIGAAALSLTIGAVALNLALRRERRRGTFGQY